MLYDKNKVEVEGWRQPGRDVVKEWWDKILKMHDDKIESLGQVYKYELKVGMIFTDFCGEKMRDVMYIGRRVWSW